MCSIRSTFASELEESVLVDYLLELLELSRKVILRLSLRQNDLETWARSIRTPRIDSERLISFGVMCFRFDDHASCSIQPKILYCLGSRLTTPKAESSIKRRIFDALMFTAVRRTIAEQRSEAEAESDEQLKRLISTAKSLEGRLNVNAEREFGELLSTQNEIEQVTAQLQKEVRVFKTNSDLWNESIRELNGALKNFGDLESYFTSVTERLEEIAKRIEKLKDRSREQ